MEANAALKGNVLFSRWSHSSLFVSCEADLIEGETGVCVCVGGGVSLLSYPLNRGEEMESSAPGKGLVSEKCRQFVHRNRRKAVHLHTAANRQVDAIVGTCGVLLLLFSLHKRQHHQLRVRRGEVLEDLRKGVWKHFLGQWGVNGPQKNVADYWF